MRLWYFIYKRRLRIMNRIGCFVNKLLFYKSIYKFYQIRMFRKLILPTFDMSIRYDVTYLGEQIQFFYQKKISATRASDLNRNETKWRSIESNINFEYLEIGILRLKDHWPILICRPKDNFYASYRFLLNPYLHPRICLCYLS